MNVENDFLNFSWKSSGYNCCYFISEILNWYCFLKQACIWSFPFCIYSDLDRIWRFKGFYCKFSYAVEIYENMEEGKMMRSMINILDKGERTFKLEFPLMADN